MAEQSMRSVSSLLSGIPPLFTKLASSLQGELDCSKQCLESHSTDGSPLYVRPQAVTYPKNATDIKQILSFAKEYSMPITVRGYGTSRTGGALGEGIIIDMTRYFTHIRQVNMLEHTITVDAGVSVKTLREKLHSWHMDVPVLTGADATSTIGALVATKSATPSTFHHGTIREWIEALTVVVDSGEEHRIADGITPSGRLLGIYQNIFPILSEEAPILRAAKPEAADDATGYCLWNTSIGPRQLLDELTGSEGTLGILTSITLRLAPHKPLSHSIAIFINDVSKLRTLIDIAKHHNAEHIFLYDKTFSDLTEKYHPGKLPQRGAQYALLVTHYGTDPDQLHNTSRTFVRALALPETEISTLEDQNLLEHITDHTYIQTLLQGYTGGAQIPITFGDGIIVPQQKYVETLEKLDTYLGSTGRLYTLSGNAGSGHISAITLFDPKSPSYEKDLTLYTETISKLVAQSKGGLSAVGGDGLLRSAYLPYIFNEATLAVFRKIKHAWDPHGILNPPKKISTSSDYVHKHIARL